MPSEGERQVQILKGKEGMLHKAIVFLTEPEGCRSSSLKALEIICQYGKESECFPEQLFPQKRFISAQPSGSERLVQIQDALSH